MTGPAGVARRSAAALAVIAAAALACGARAGILETTDAAGSIHLGPSAVPPVFLGAYGDFSLLGWLRRTSRRPGAVWNVIDAGGVLRVAVDDAARAIVVRLEGAPQSFYLVVPLREATPEAMVPADEWILFAASWDTAQRRLTAWAQSESVPLVGATASEPGWTGGTPWPVSLGATGGEDGFTGQLGLVVLRDHQITAADLVSIWNGGAPHYFAPALLESGNLTGFGGVEWMIGHAVLTQPDTLVNPSAEGAELGGAVTPNDLPVYSAAGSGTFHSAGVVQSVTGTWTLHSPHEAGAPFAGFFVRELPDLGLAVPPRVSRVSPLARRLADDEPQGQGLIRVVASANSRAVRFFYSYGGWENWSFGGLYEVRKSSVAGVTVPASGLEFAPWPGFYFNARQAGPVQDTSTTALPSVAFGNFGSHGVANLTHYPGYLLAGRAIVIEDGGAYVPKARPESGTLFDERTDPLTVRAMVLKFPGSGDVVVQGEKAASQHGEDVTPDGAPATTVLDTTVLEHAMTPADGFSAATLTLTLDGLPPGVAVGHACFIAAGVGAGGVSMVTGVETRGDATVLTLERWFPVDPDPASSVLRFGPVDVEWVAHAWAGLAADDPEEYRGVRLTASGGIVVVLYQECFNPDADGFVIGAAGLSGAGYTIQLRDLFDTGGVPYMKGLAADVWLQFFAHQFSPASCMGDYAAAIRAASPATEIWWCGDPDLDTGVDDVEGTDAWQQWILDNAEAFDVGAVVAQEHPTIGTGSERAADGQAANRSHLSARGCAMYVSAVLDMMHEAALDAPPCPADLDGGGAVGFSDLLALLGAWGPCPPGACPADLDGDDAVGFSDLLVVLSAWGPCG